MRSARAAWLAALVLLVGAAGTDAAGTSRTHATPAAAPFAEAWAKVPSSPAARKAQNIVVFGAHSDFPGFNTWLACCNSLWANFAGVTETLHGAFIQNDRGDWVRDLVSAASANKAGVSYTIKPNANWYWGGKKVPVTYKDFVYTVQKIDDPSSHVAGRAGYSNLDASHFTHKGDKQVTFSWKTSNCSTDFPCGPYANWEALFNNLYPSFALVEMDFNTIWTSCICGSDGRPVSNGPFYLSNYTKGQGTTLKRNPYWAGRKPAVAEVDFKIITDPSAEEEAMRGGQVDAIQPPFSPILLPLKHARGITFEQTPGYVFDHLEFREGSAKGGSSVTKPSSNVLLRTPWMRQAIMLGIDRQRIVNTVFGELAGIVKPLDNMVFYSTQTSYRPDFHQWNYDAAKALAILKKHCAPGSGPPAPSAANTKTWQCSGLPATFNWTWKVDSDAWRTTEQIAKAELQSIGIQINETPLAADAIFGPNGIASGNFDIVEFTWITGGDAGDFYDIYRCFGETNYTGYCSHTVDDLLTRANSAVDPVKRASLYQRADAILATQVPMVPLYQRPVPLIHRSDLRGMRPNPGQSGPVWNIEDWHWKP